MIEAHDERWVRSTYCNGVDSTCVEVTVGANQVGVRDGKEDNGSVLLFNIEEWRVFVRGIRAGDFNV